MLNIEDWGILKFSSLCGGGKGSSKFSCSFNFMVHLHMRESGREGGRKGERGRNFKEREEYVNTYTCKFPRLSF